MGKKKIASKNIIEGLVIPSKWGGNGKIIGIAIHTDQEDDILSIIE